MATKEELPDFDDLDPVEVENEANGNNWLNVDGGEKVGGEVTGFRPRAGRNGVVEIDGKPMSLNATLRRQIIEARVVGSTIVIRAAEEESTFTNDDGEEVTYHEKEARFA